MDERKLPGQFRDLQSKTSVDVQHEKITPDDGKCRQIRYKVGSAADAQEPCTVHRQRRFCYADACRRQHEGHQRLPAPPARQPAPQAVKRQQNQDHHNNDLKGIHWNNSRPESDDDPTNVPILSG